MIRFNEYFGGKYYYEMGESEVNDYYDPIDDYLDQCRHNTTDSYMLSNFDIDLFTDSEFNYIDLFVGNNISGSDVYGITYSDATPYRSGLCININLDKDFSKSITIDKMRDDRFILKYFRKDGGIINILWYKCDQVDGVCQCLSDIIGVSLVVNESSFVGISLSDYRGYYKNTGHGYLDIISDREFGLVSDLVSGFCGVYKCKLESYSSGLWNCINIYIYDGRRRCRYINIDKMVDEWFMVDVYSGDQYRCDQLDGLLDCLRYINEKK